MLLTTHLIFALSMAYILRFPVLAAAIGGVAPDMDVVLDYGYPLIHRGIVHTPLFLAVVCLAIFALTRKKEYMYGFAIGFISHLLIDTANPTGILWLYPMATYLTLNLATYSSVFANIGITLFSSAFIVLLNPQILSGIGIKYNAKYSDNMRFAFLVILIVGSFGIAALAGSLTGYSAEGGSTYNPTGSYSGYTVSQLMTQLPVDQYVEVSGQVSEVQSDYVSKKGYEYQRFYISDDKEEVLVFCSKYKGTADVSKDDSVSVRGLFQKYSSSYEIYAECGDVGKS